MLNHGMCELVWCRYAIKMQMKYALAFPVAGKF